MNNRRTTERTFKLFIAPLHNAIPTERRNKNKNQIQRESKKKKNKLLVKKAVPAKYMTTSRGCWVLAIAKAKCVHLQTPLAA